MNKPSPPPVLADAPADVTLEGPELLGPGFRRYERFSVTLDHGGTPATLSRDILRIGRTVGMIAVDLARDEIVLIRQFRLAAHLATGHGDIVEIPAGYIDGGETPEGAAHRECIEEIGVAPRAMREVFSFMPAPGMLEEFAHIFLVSVDAAQVPEQAGATYEIEHTRPVRVPIDEAIASLSAGAVHNGYLLLALQWLALNRHRLAVLLGED
ncbi:NUDIX hydrolase [Rhodoplanes sp. TEM]|uniref:GDP-mannose pyrophosphatase n=1 Tax=Rhodoplanes tepidamans TaxID=200616 RepID=A0ABT5J813_RHOTP|nr:MULTISPECIES: NUDIX hydrolase [Rhodoplanes]MDC7785774.1 NUDIX hydrolase [Rhodoplanes tepidamans]MDC7984041.1 NUDIX hydrolase [Rhodoplanes sp. TEM]MDQ0354664.1 ADP-ribose pyrophosphatase [Rhodoplanes tepidamans]